MTVGDLDGNGFADVIYVGDTGGRMWRFSSTTLYDSNVPNWTGNIIFDSNPGYDFVDVNGDPIEPPTENVNDIGRKIFYRPAVSVINGKPHLWFGTGDRAHPLNHSVIDRIYQIVDRGQTSGSNADGTRINEKNLVDLTTNPLQSGDGTTVTNTLNKLYNNVAGPGGESDYYHGWLLKLNWDYDSTETDKESLIVGEKMLAAPVMFNNEAYYTTYTPKVNPNADNSCAVGNLGSSHLYHLSALTGEAVFNYDLINDSDYDSLDADSRAKGADGQVLTRSDRVRSLGEGIPSGIVTLIDASGRVTMLISSSNRVETYNAPDIKLISPVYWMQW